MGFTRDFRRILIKEKNKEMLEYDYKFHTSINIEKKKEMQINFISETIIKEYLNSDGFMIFWWKNSLKEIGGKLDFSSSEYLLKNEPTLKIECDMDPNMDQELRYFRFFDVPTMNSQIGFFALPNQKPSKNLYFRMVGDKWASDLDLDVEGYLKMALASRVFFYWQIVLIDIQGETESNETKIFKEEMPKIFSDFNWEEFVKLYQSLRLSKNEK